MNSDNYYVVYPAESGGFAARLVENGRILLNTEKYHTYPTPKEAAASVGEEYVEYGVRIDKSCYDKCITLRASDLKACHLGLQLMYSNFKYQIVSITHHLDHVEVKTSDRGTLIYRKDKILELYRKKDS